MTDHFHAPDFRAGESVYWVLSPNSIASTTVVSSIHQRGIDAHTYRVALKPEIEVPERKLCRSWPEACLLADAIGRLLT